MLASVWVANPAVRHNESEGRRWSAQVRVLLWGHIVNLKCETTCNLMSDIQ